MRRIAELYRALLLFQSCSEPPHLPDDDDDDWWNLD